MRDFSGNLGDQCIVYGSQNQIRAYHHDSMDRPYVIASRPGHVTAIAPVDGIDGGLLDCGHYRSVNETLSGKQVGRTQKHPVFSVGRYDGRIVAVEGDNTARMFDLKSNKTLFNFEYKRPWSFYMATGKDGIYYANVNVSRMERKSGGRLAKKTLTSRIADDVPLAADANGNVFSLSCMNPGMNPKGAEVMDVSSGNMLACWSMKEGPDFPGYNKFFTFDRRNNIVAGTHKFEPGEGCHLLYVNVSDWKELDAGAAVCEPQLLLENAFEESMYCVGSGNPITIIPFSQAEQFLRHAKKA